MRTTVPLYVAINLLHLEVKGYKEDRLADAAACILARAGVRLVQSCLTVVPDAIATQVASYIEGEPGAVNPFQPERK